MRTELINAINTYPLPVLTYSIGILNWSYKELEEIRRTTRTMLTNSNNHHPKCSTIRMTLPKREGGLQENVVKVLNVQSHLSTSN